MGITLSFIGIILVLIFLTATVLTIVSVALRRKKAANVLNILVVIFSSISILATGFIALGQLTGTKLAVNLSGTDDAEEATDLRSLCSNQVRFLENSGYSDIRIRLADICEANGKEAICCYYNGRTYIIDIYAVRNGSLDTIYSKEGSTGSVYLLEMGGKLYLLDYSQNLSSDNYTQSYTYSLFRFDNRYSPVITDENRFTVSAGSEGGGSTGAHFFTSFNAYLADAMVCYDPYALKGYHVMSGNTSNEDSVAPAAKYLNITNCNTSKVGIVTMKKDTSWLNLRSGPGTHYNPVLIDPSDDDSCVKQTQYSIVTVMEPYNTGDSKNPIWYRMRITYQNRTLEGYSSQRYINVENMTTLSRGSSMTVNISTNDTGAFFTTSDSSIASVDPYTGEVYGNRAGIVLISVVTDSGLSDSCLIEIK